MKLQAGLSLLIVLTLVAITLASAVLNAATGLPAVLEQADEWRTG